MQRSVLITGSMFLFLVLCSCNNEQKIKEQIQANQQLLIKKQTELSDLNYKVTSNSLRVGTSKYDSSIGKNFDERSAMMQSSIDSLKAATDLLEQELSK